MTVASPENSRSSKYIILSTLLIYHPSIIEGTKEALERLQLDYVDVIFAHRPDPTGMSISIKHKV